MTPYQTKTMEMIEAYSDADYHDQYEPDDSFQQITGVSK